MPQWRCELRLIRGGSPPSNLGRKSAFPLKRTFVVLLLSSSFFPLLLHPPLSLLSQTVHSDFLANSDRQVLHWSKLNHTHIYDPVLFLFIFPFLSLLYLSPFSKWAHITPGRYGTEALCWGLQKKQKLMTWTRNGSEPELPTATAVPHNPCFVTTPLVHRTKKKRLYIVLLLLFFPPPSTPANRPHTSCAVGAVTLNIRSGWMYHPKNVIMPVFELEGVTLKNLRAW